MSADVDLFVCITCGARAGDATERPGQALAGAIRTQLGEIGAQHITVREVECLAVCKRPGTIALAASGKWTYVIGDLDPANHAADIAAAAVAFQRSANGIVPWAERPLSFRKGVISRIPPLGFEQTATEKS